MWMGSVTFSQEQESEASMDTGSPVMSMLISHAEIMVVGVNVFKGKKRPVPQKYFVTDGAYGL